MKSKTKKHGSALIPQVTPREARLKEAIHTLEAELRAALEQVQPLTEANKKLLRERNAAQTEAHPSRTGDAEPRLLTQEEMKDDRPPIGHSFGLAMPVDGREELRREVEAQFELRKYRLVVWLDDGYRSGDKPTVRQVKVTVSEVVGVNR
jgi:hypothetical protein